MDVSAMFSDDQLAVMSCFAALAICGLIAAMSFHLGPAGQQNRADKRSAPMPRVTTSTEKTARQNRKAA